ncbi:MAG: endonuclease III domain-containing protein [Actinomycetes bacterium]
MRLTRDPDRVAWQSLGNKTEPYDELVYILLTLMTRSQARLDRAFEGLHSATGQSWSYLSEVPPEDLHAILAPLGFANRRAEQLLGCVRRIEDDLGGTLEPLREWSDEDALAYLISLPGVGTKTAKCVMMYSLGRQVFPVDIHVLRVAKRLGWVPMDASWTEADRLLEQIVPDELKFDLHVLVVVHGREVCKSRDPQCDDCVLADICPSSHDTPRLRADFV